MKSNTDNEYTILSVCHSLIEGTGTMDRQHLSAFIAEMLDWLRHGERDEVYNLLPQGDRPPTRRELLTLLHEAELHVLQELQETERGLAFEEDRPATTDEEILEALERLPD